MTRPALRTTAAKLSASLLVAVGLLGTTALRADDFDALDDPQHLDELAAELQKVSNALCWEMHRYHRDQPDFGEAYRPAKEVWGMAGALRDALRDGMIDSSSLAGRLTRMKEFYADVESIAGKWGDGIRPSNPPLAVEERAVVVPGPVDIDIPLLFGGGIRVGGRSRVIVTDPDPVTLPRRQLHPNARGSRRALERHLTTVRTALDYLLEDAAVAPPDAPQAAPPDAPRAAPPAAEAPRPMPPERANGPVLAPPVKIAPRSAARRG